MQPFLDFLIESAKVTDPSYTPSTPTQQKMRTSGDHFQAWRDQAPSRAHILKPDGPFDPKWILTREGMFSVLLFRGVTFSAPAALQHPTGRFADLAAWNTFVQVNKEKGNSFLCNVRAYGNGVGRGPRVVLRLWESSAELLERLTAEKKPTFDEIWDHIATGRSAKDGEMLYPTMGLLIGYLLCVDLVSAGVLDPPSLDRMGEIVYEIGMGGREGLRKLRLIGERASKEEVSLAFRSLYDFLQDKFALQFPDLHFDMFILEHGLCKYKRLIK